MLHFPPTLEFRIRIETKILFNCNSLFPCFIEEFYSLFFESIFGIVLANFPMEITIVTVCVTTRPPPMRPARQFSS